MLDVNVLSDSVLEAITKYLVDDFEDEVQCEKALEKIANMSTSDAFDAFLNWHGLMNWSTTIMEAIKNIKEAEL